MAAGCQEWRFVLSFFVLLTFFGGVSCASYSNSRCTKTEVYNCLENKGSVDYSQDILREACQHLPTAKACLNRIHCSLGDDGYSDKNIMQIGLDFDQKYLCNAQLQSNPCMKTIVKCVNQSLHMMLKDRNLCRYFRNYDDCLDRYAVETCGQAAISAGEMKIKEIAETQFNCDLDAAQQRSGAEGNATKNMITMMMMMMMSACTFTWHFFDFVF